MLPRFRLFLLATGLGLLSLRPLHAQTPETEPHTLPLHGRLQASPADTILETPEAALQAYRDGRFEILPEHLGRGYRRAPVWLALDIDLQALGQESAVLEVAPAFLDKVTAYLAQNGQPLRLLGRAGDQVPVADTPLQGLKPAFLLQPPHKGRATVLLLIETTSTQAAIVSLRRLQVLNSAEI